MATQRNTTPQFDRPFRLFAAGSRVLAQNAAGKIIDIGAIEYGARHACSIKLDVDGIETGPQPDATQALGALIPILTFDYLDGLFTSEANARFEGVIEDLPHVSLTLPEPVPREFTDRRPPELF